MNRALIFTILLSTNSVLQAASVELHYGFRDGAHYQVTQQYRHIGTTSTTMNREGRLLTMETPVNQNSTNRWLAKTQRRGENVIFNVGYGQHEGAKLQGLPLDSTNSKHYRDSYATVVFDQQGGLQRLIAHPGNDPAIELIYRRRFHWMPPLPQNPIKPGDSFSHRYRIRSGMVTVEGEEKYTLDQLNDGYAYFIVNSQNVLSYDYREHYRLMEDVPQGLGELMGSLKLRLQGRGSAIFNLKEGIFVEREIENTYSSQPAATQGRLNQQHRGTVRERWVMERR